MVQVCCEIFAIGLDEDSEITNIRSRISFDDKKEFCANNLKN